MTEDQFWEDMSKQGISKNSLFTIPGVSLRMVVIDCLHCLDLGVTQDVVGNLFREYLQGSFCDGSNANKKLKSLLLQLKAHYKEHKTPTRIQNITSDMIQRSGKPPKLRAKGAETRCIVPFVVECARKMHEEMDDMHSFTVFRCVASLADYYMLMSLDEWKPALAKQACRQFCVLYKALSDEASAKYNHDVFWRLKPKFHMFQEMAEYPGFVLGNPRTFWNYMDEDFVGWVASMAKSRGGPRRERPLR